MRMMPRHELWRRNYRAMRDLTHLSSEELSERVFDCINNIRVRTEQGKLGIRPPAEAERWSVWMTEVFEECELRGWQVPGPNLDISRFSKVFEHAFKPIPAIETVLKAHNASNRKYALKFGDMSWLPDALAKGEFLVSTASYYEKNEHNHARKDEELVRRIRPHTTRKDLDDFLNREGLTPTPGKVLGEVHVRAKCDYYLFSLSAAYTSRLFGDFGSSACLAIYDPGLFVDRLVAAVAPFLPNWECQMGLVTYYDPVRAHPDRLDVQFYKPFRHAYQNELRFTWTPRNLRDVPPVERLHVSLGPLTDCAEIVDLASCPPLT
jgi:hypothetical protein